MNKFIIFIVLGCILLYFIMINNNEFFGNSNSPIELTDADLEYIKNSIDKVADNIFTEAKNNLGEKNIKQLIDSFLKTTESTKENKKNLFDEDIFVQNILNNENIHLSNNFKQSLYLELLEAYAFNKKLEIIPVRLIATEIITNEENLNKIIEGLPTYTRLKNISKTLILYLLKYYDNTVSSDKSKYDSDMMSLEQINKLIIKNKNL